MDGGAVRADTPLESGVHEGSDGGFPGAVPPTAAAVFR